MIPIVITAYNRLDSLKKTLDSLFECDGIEGRQVIAFVDRSYKPDVKNLLKGYKVGYIERHKHIGLRKNSLGAITAMLEHHNKIIFIQDDMQFSKDFLLYMDWALNEFEDRKDIMFVSGYSHIDFDTSPYLSPLIADGLGIWKRKWHIPKGLPFVSKYRYKQFAKRTTHSFASYLKDIREGRSDAFMAELCFQMDYWSARCLHPGRNKLRYCVSDSTNSKKKDSKKLNNILHEGFSKELDTSDTAYNIIKGTKNYKWSKLKRFTRWMRTNLK